MFLRKTLTFVFFSYRFCLLIKFDVASLDKKMKALVTKAKIAELDWDQLKKGLVRLINQWNKKKVETVGDEVRGEGWGKELARGSYW